MVVNRSRIAKSKQKALAPEVLRRLLAHNPAPRLALNWTNPLELLVAVILSAQCTDARVNEVTKTLFQKYRTAKDYAQADPATFEQEIRATGFYRNKAKLVIGCCRKLVDDFGGKVPASLEELVTLPGVGRKTANMVLGNAFGEPGIAVDTHVTRVSQRLGLVSEAQDAEAIERALMPQVPRAQWTAFSNAMILHGREVCTARAPHCGECVLNDVCPWPNKRK
jgi:endonuclease-3